MKSIEECIHHFEIKKNEKFDLERHDISDFMMECFSNLFNSYAKSYNKVYRRKGALFQDYLKRMEITDELEIRQLINYIHINAWHHNFCDAPFDWEWTSFYSILDEKDESLINRTEVLKLYGGEKGFLDDHTRAVRFRAEYEFMPGVIKVQTYKVLKPIRS